MQLPGASVCCVRQAAALAGQCARALRGVRVAPASHQRDVHEASGRARSTHGWINRKLGRRHPHSHHLCRWDCHPRQLPRGHVPARAPCERRSKHRPACPKHCAQASRLRVRHGMGLSSGWHRAESWRRGQGRFELPLRARGLGLGFELRAIASGSRHTSSPMPPTPSTVSSFAPPVRGARLGADAVR